MGNHYHDTLFTSEVKKYQSDLGSREHYSEYEGDDAKANTELGEAEAMFISQRDNFFMASVSETGWPYVQHRGGPVGFLRVLDNKTLGFADFRGNRQYISIGNFKSNDRVSLILTDFANRRRIKVIGHARVEPIESDEFSNALETPGYRAKAERAIIIDVEAFEWNCPQHIRERYTVGDFARATDGLQRRIAALESVLEANNIPLPS